MSADLLRRAAAKMRERATAATAGPWGQVVSEQWGPQAAIYTPVSNLNIHEHANPGEYRGGQNAEHIASWHPAVALEVADLMVWLAADRESDPYLPKCFDAAALAVARAYLGEATDGR